MSETEAPPSIWHRLHHALGPIAFGMLLDGVDFATFGPIGLYAGPLLGGLVGYWAGATYGFSSRGRWLLALVAGLYCAAPFTETLPLATLVSATSRFLSPRSG